MPLETEEMTKSYYIDIFFQRFQEIKEILWLWLEEKNQEVETIENQNLLKLLKLQMINNHELQIMKEDKQKLESELIKNWKPLPYLKSKSRFYQRIGINMPISINKLISKMETRNHEIMETLAMCNYWKIFFNEESIIFDKIIEMIKKYNNNKDNNPAILNNWLKYELKNIEKLLINYEKKLKKLQIEAKNEIITTTHKFNTFELNISKFAECTLKYKTQLPSHSKLEVKLNKINAKELETDEKNIIFGEYALKYNTELLSNSELKVKSKINCCIL